MKYIMDTWLPTYPGQPNEMVDNVCVNTVLLGKPWEPRVMEAAELACKTGQLVIEIGASYGLHTRLLAGSNEVLALEPQHAAFQCLAANTADTDHPVTCINVGAYDNQRILGVSEVQEDPHAIDQPGHPSAVLVPASDGVAASYVDGLIDAIYGPSRRPNVCLIKVDAQGADFPALRGCHDTIQRSKPGILFEYEEKMARQHHWEFDDLREWLGDLGIPGVVYQLGDGINFFFDVDDNGPADHWKEIIRFPVPVPVVQAPPASVGKKKTRKKAAAKGA